MKDAADSGPRSVLRILALLELIAQHPGGMSLAEISKELALPKSSLLGLLRPLVSADYLAQGEAGYQLGSRIFHLSAAILERRRFPRLARQYLSELSERCGESVFLVAVDRQAEKVIYVDAIESDQAVRYFVPSGSVRPLYCSAAGLCLLSFQDEAWREAYLGRVEIEPLTEFTVSDVAALRERCKTIRANGVATSLREAVIDAAGMAAPIFGYDGRVDYAVLIGMPAERFARKQKELERLIKETAARVSYALGADASAV